MELTRFIKENKSMWTELEQQLELLDKRSGKLQSGHLDRFTELYKTVSSHLSAMQTYSPADETTVYLNHLVSRAHNAMYKENNKSGTQLKTFFLHHFPLLIQARGWFVVAALLLFILGGLLGFLSVRQDR
ncbi:stage II sporulation protein M [Paenibacillus hexagrammi]|uniref:Uncharacterized protein n=1 Tax=Paenibacillus hexagrammi TaxID=2908839 RepID=A0ABY3SF90_9BACL|nr:hypothetical protein [Paenibacillus sp. YPD9-1]UJF32576.1 hypothetical protein L0M14_23465 [Paenibacillus sp. YPD9-1]